MSFAVAILLVLVATGCASLAVAALALAHVVDGWGVFFFYVLPTILFAAWALRELAPELWRRAATPLRWSWRHSVLAAPARAQPPPLPPRPPRAIGEETRWGQPRRLLEGALRPWMLGMRLLLGVLRTPRIRRLVNVGFGLAAFAVLALVVDGFTRIGWPLHRTHVSLVAAAGAFFLSSFGLKAFGWQRLFRPTERPRSLALAAATGAAAVIGLALPGRFDDAARVAIVHRLPGRTPSVGTLVLSLFLLGMIDAGALAPFAAAGAILGPTSVGVRIGMGIVAGGGLGALLLVAGLPWIRTHDRLGRYRLTHWLGRHTPDSPRDAAWAWTLVAASWITRVVGIFLLLDALGLGVSFPLAISYLTAGAAAAALPISPAGAATQAGVGAAVLATAGIGGEQAVAFGVAAQALTVLAGGAVVGFAALVHACLRLRRAIPAWSGG